MSLVKETIVDKIEVVQNGIIQVRTIVQVLEDGKEISNSFHRHAINPGDDYSKQEERVRAICSATHTPEVIEAYKAATAAQGV